MHEPIRLFRNRITIQIQQHIRAIRIIHERPGPSNPRDINARAGCKEFGAERLPHPDIAWDCGVVYHLGSLVGNTLCIQESGELDADGDFVGAAIGLDRLEAVS